MSRARKYPEELLERGVRLTLESGRPIAHVAADLGIVGWQLATHMRTDFVLDALRMALGQRGPGADVELIHHSDRGSQGSTRASTTARPSSRRPRLRRKRR
jgi:transposase InsO family protein